MAAKPNNLLPAGKKLPVVLKARHPTPALLEQNMIVSYPSASKKVRVATIELQELASTPRIVLVDSTKTWSNRSIASSQVTQRNTTGGKDVVHVIAATTKLPAPASNAAQVA